MLPSFAASRIRVSVVIPTYNRRHVLARTLPSILVQDFDPGGFEIVVVVDGSTDGTAEFLCGIDSEAVLRVVEQPNRGLPAARNAGVAAAEGDIVLFLDDDIVCEPGLLEAHVGAHRGTSSGSLVVFGPVLLAQGSPAGLATDLMRAQVEEKLERLESGTLHWPDDAMIAANYSASRRLFLENRYDESFTGSLEDFEFGLRLWRMGVAFRYAPAARVHQLYVKSASDRVRRDAAAFGRQEVRLCRKEPEYRPHSFLARVFGGSRTRRLYRQAVARAPLNPEPLLAGLTRLAEHARAIPQVRRAGLRLIRARQGIALSRAALDEAGSWGALRREFGTPLPVLLYHRVGPAVPGPHPELTVTPETFVQHVRWMARRGYRGIRPSDWLAWRRGEGVLPDKPVLVTFDDGYAELAEHAFPALEHCGFSAAVFLITARLGAATAWDGQPLLGVEQVRHWAGRGIEFGSHSRTHPDLTRISATELVGEVAGSREDLSHLLGQAPVSFAYPFGPYDAEVLRVVRTEFPLAFTCEEGLNDLATDSHRLRRTVVQPDDSPLAVHCRLLLGWSPWGHLRSRVRLRTRLREARRRWRGAVSS